MNYSVPYEYVSKEVEVRLTQTLVEIFYKGKRISSHPRLKGIKHQYATSETHMPENHQKAIMNGERFRAWASEIGPHTYTVIDQLLKTSRIEEQSYRRCLLMMKLADKYQKTRLEMACQLALAHISSPSYKNIRLILESGQDKTFGENQKQSDETPTEHAFIRGHKYYGGNNHE